MGTRPCLSLRSMHQCCRLFVSLSAQVVITGTLRKRSNSELTYGNHMAIHMGIGFLFMGAGAFFDCLQYIFQ